MNAAKPKKPPRGRPRLPQDQVQSEWVRERVTPAQMHLYRQLGGKAWLIRELNKGAKKVESKAQATPGSSATTEGAIR